MIIVQDMKLVKENQQQLNMCDCVYVYVCECALGAVRTFIVKTDRLESYTTDLNPNDRICDRKEKRPTKRRVTIKQC